MNDTARTTISSAARSGGLLPGETAPTKIFLDKVTKVYEGTKEPAVGELTLEIPEGEIVVLVGPSGCGKSTTLRLINRMIEPSSGRIYFDDDDVTNVNADQLRRRIGYVIQEVGLFPHNTIAQNIATVPRMLGWNRKQIRDRVDELLEMVGMDPAIYRGRYPKELSGGQAQRVGVARALGSDPEVMLMDEPFGAIDPITRGRLQNEFLRLQSELKKTIVFVTHDIDEAIKMGDRIAILKDQSKIAQFDKPERILAFPVDDFVEDFIGSGATLKGLNLERVRDVELGEFPVAQEHEDRSTILGRLRQSNCKCVLLLDERRRPFRWIDERDIESDGRLRDQGIPVVAKVEKHATLRDALEEMLQSNDGTTPVVDKSGAYEGVIEIERLIDVIKRLRHEAQRHYEELAELGEVAM